MISRVWYGLDAMLIGALRLTDTELIIFRWFVGFVKSGKMQNFEKYGRRYFWVLHKKAASDLCFLQQKTEQTIRKTFQRLVGKKVLHFIEVHENSSWYALSENGSNLIKPIAKAANKKVSRPADHKSVHPQARAFSKPEFETSADIIKRLYPGYSSS